jgi:polysaccharide pyruvyl transferase WcaK-like protein
MLNKRFIIIGSYGENNFGDDALMHTIYNYFSVNFPNHEIFFRVSQKYSKKFKGDRFKTIEEYQINKNDIIIFGGGTQFFSFQNLRLTLKTFIKLGYIFSFYKLVQILKGLISSKQMVAIGIGLGPFNRIGHTIEIKYFLKQFKYIAVRDSYSLDFCIKNNILNSKLYPDICYSDYFLNEIEIAKLYDVEKGKVESKKIAIVIRDWNHIVDGNNYLDNVFEAAKTLENLGYEIHFILFAGENDAYSYNKLLESNFQFHKWNYEQMAIKDLFTLISTFDLIITSRFHAAVFANILKKPVICIEIDQKLDFFVKSVNNYAFIWRSPFVVHECISLVKMIFKYNIQTNLIENEVAEKRKQSNEMFNELTNYLKCIK